MRESAGPALKVLRVLVRGPAVVCLACCCFLECLLSASLRGTGTTRSKILQRWSKRILARMAVEMSVCGPVPARGLIASNHISYIDILALSAATQCLFVSKNEVKSWPIIGWVASLTGSVFVDRSRRSQTHHLRPQMQERLESGDVLVLFPEATSSDGYGILPFHSPFFQAAVAAAAPITASYISYELTAGDGDAHSDVCYWGNMVLIPHLIKLLTKTGVRATIRFADQPRVFSDRKQAAKTMETAVKELEDSAKTFIPEAAGNAVRDGATIGFTPD